MDTKKYAEELDVSEEDVQDAVDKIKSELSRAVNLTEEEVDKRVEILIKQSFRARKMQLSRSPAKKFDAIILGSGGLRDASSWMRKQQMDSLRADPEKAISEFKARVCPEGSPNSVEIDGVSYQMLDSRQSFPSGDVNKNFKSVIPLTNPRRMYFGVLGKEEGLIPFLLGTRGDKALMDMPFFEFGSFYAIDTSRTDYKGMNVLWDSPALTDPLKSDGTRLADDEIEKTLRGLDKYWIELADLDEWHENNQNEFNRMFLAEADVTQIYVKNDKMSMVLGCEDSNTYNCWVPEDLEVDFGQFSRVIVLGKTSVRTMENEDVVQIQAWMLWAIPKYKVDMVDGQ